MKNRTPREIAFITALYVAVIAGVLMLPAFLLYTDSWEPWLIYGVTVILIFAVAWISVNTGIEKFIHRRIKLIYKTIHRFKTQSGNMEDLDLSKDVLGQVNTEVEEWARSNKEEIEQLRKQEQFRKEFIGNLSHELKTPIFSIQGYLLTLLEGGLEDPKINRDYLERADRNLERLTNLINELDEITKLESGERRMEFTKFDLVKHADDLVKELEFRAKESNVTLTVRDPKMSVWVEADRSKISQVLTNLIMNSIKYSREDGGETSIKFYDMDENILVEVEDNGLGIAADHLPRLFERFYRIDKSRSRHQGGSGLGLAIVKHIIESHGQTINVRSQEGEGSTFSFTLKKAKPQ